MDREMSTTEFVLKFVSLYITFKYLALFHRNILLRVWQEPEQDLPGSNWRSSQGPLFTCGWAIATSMREDVIYNIFSQWLKPYPSMYRKNGLSIKLLF